MAVQQLYILGAGGQSLDFADLVDSLNRIEPLYDLLGFLDDDTTLHGREVMGVPVLGPVDLAAEHPQVLLACGILSPPNLGLRPRLAARAGGDPSRWVNLVHPTAWVSPRARLQGGAVIMAGASVCAGAELGFGVTLLPGAVVSHHSVIGAHSVLASRAVVSGRCQVGRCCYLGAGSLVREDLAIGDGALLGMGAVVVKDVPEGQRWAGVPARPLSPRS